MRKVITVLTLAAGCTAAPAPEQAPAESSLPDKTVIIRENERHLDRPSR